MLQPGLERSGGPGKGNQSDLLRPGFRGFFHVQQLVSEIGCPYIQSPLRPWRPLREAAVSWQLSDLTTVVL